MGGLERIITHLHVMNQWQCRHASNRAEEYTQEVGFS